MLPYVPMFVNTGFAMCSTSQNQIENLQERFLSFLGDEFTASTPLKMPFFEKKKPFLLKIEISQI